MVVITLCVEYFLFLKNRFIQSKFRILCIIETVWYVFVSRLVAHSALINECSSAESSPSYSVQDLQLRARSKEDRPRDSGLQQSLHSRFISKLLSSWKHVVLYLFSFWCFWRSVKEGKREYSHFFFSVKTTRTRCWDEIILEISVKIQKNQLQSIWRNHFIFGGTATYMYTKAVFLYQN